MLALRRQGKVANQDTNVKSLINYFLRPITVLSEKLKIGIIRNNFTKKMLNKTFATAMLIASAGMSSQAFATNIVINGSFENGATGFTSSYSTGSHNLYSAGQYEVGSNPQNYHP